MSSPKAGKRRVDTDVIKLIESKHQVTVKSDNMNDLIVKFYGPMGTLYEAGVWRVRVNLPDEYPFKSPSVSFLNRIYHPNIDEDTGVVCLDVINQKYIYLRAITPAKFIHFFETDGIDHFIYERFRGCVQHSTVALSFSFLGSGTARRAG